MDEEDPERIVPVSRTEGQRTVSAPAATLGPSLAAAAVSRQHGQPQSHPPPHQHQYPQPTHPQSMPGTSLPNTSMTSTASTTTKQPTLSRSLSRKEQVKAYVKKETREFFGLDESSEDSQRQRWQDKRKRLASRKYGQLKDQTNTTHHTQSFTNSDFHALSELQEGLGGGLADSVDAATWPQVPHPGKDSVAKMTWDGLSYAVSTVARRRAKSQISGTAGGRSKSRSYAPSSMSVPDDVFDEPDVSPTTTATTTTTTTTAATMRPTPPVDHCTMEPLSDEVIIRHLGSW